MTATPGAPRFARALVTGASGFVGSRLARHLVAAGTQTTVLMRPSSSLDQLGEAANSVTVLRCEADTDAVRDAVARAGPEIVFHLAATYIAAHRPGDIERLVADNVLLTARLCQGAAEAGCAALIHAGTAWQNAGSAPGDPSPAPNSLYAATKQGADDVVSAFAASGAFPAVTVKIYDSYGPGDPRRKFLKALADASASGATIPVNPGDQRLHLVHVDDVVAGFVHAANLALDGTLAGHASHTLPSPRTVSLRELAEAWQRATGRSVRLAWGAQPYRAGEVMVPWEGVPLPGWAPAIALEDGLRTLYGRAPGPNRSAGPPDRNGRGA